MAKQRGYPDQRGLWAESDSIAEQFVPNERYKAQQRAMAQTLLAAGLNLKRSLPCYSFRKICLQVTSRKMKLLHLILRKRIRNRVFRSTRAMPKTTLRFLA
jgi:hypothetical protein